MSECQPDQRCCSCSIPEQTCCSRPSWAWIRSSRDGSAPADETLGDDRRVALMGALSGELESWEIGRFRLEARYAQTRAVEDCQLWRSDNVHAEDGHPPASGRWTKFLEQLQLPLEARPSFMRDRSGCSCASTCDEEAKQTRARMAVLCQASLTVLKLVNRRATETKSRREANSAIELTSPLLSPFIFNNSCQESQHG